MPKKNDWYDQGFHDGALAVLKDLVSGKSEDIIDKMSVWADKLERLQLREGVEHGI